MRASIAVLPLFSEGCHIFMHTPRDHFLLGTLANQLYFTPKFGALPDIVSTKVPTAFFDRAAAVTRHRQNALSDCELVAIHWMAAHQSQQPRRWLAERPLSPTDNALSFAIQSRFVKTKPLSHYALREWSSGRMHGIIAAGYVSIPDQLRVQANGQRFVGISNDPEFIEHDLCHLAKFYWDQDHCYDAAFHQRQVAFFKLMNHHAKQWIAKDWLSADEGLVKTRTLDRCASDMNGDGCFLFAALLTSLLRAEGQTVESRIERPARVLTELLSDFISQDQLSTLIAKYRSDFNEFMHEIRLLLESLFKNS
jgi:hypothetical protein